jgi:uncharacterized protein YqeY
MRDHSIQTIIPQKRGLFFSPLKGYNHTMIHENLKTELKKAMIAKDAVRLSVIRGMLAGFTNELVAKRRTPQDMLTDEEAQAVVMRQVKQRKDSIAQFMDGGRPELAESEQAELAILETFLPAMMSEDEIRAFVTEKKAAAGDVPKGDAGKFTGLIMKDLKGKADGTVVKKVVDEMLA